ncbi:MAG: Fe-S cluster assembly ATPase SufC [Bacteroidales bacterium]|nr:Fe-S cluster assembly ATPase SufC [Bacteroidales bacterium]
MAKDILLEVKDLHASVEEREILRGINLTVRRGEVHAIMGPNGAGKSTLSGVLAGKPGYTVTSGEALFDGEPLLDLAPEERSWKGVFLGFQYPTEIPGVSNTMMLKSAVAAHRRAQGLPELSSSEFIKLMNSKLQLVKMDRSFLSRGVNVGFSGGEKKRNEIFQMAMLAPQLAILDETDSGLDVDALRIVGEGVNSLRTAENAFIVITHYQRLLDYIVPDVIHVLYDGQIILTGGRELALEIEAKGYDWIINRHNGK